MIRALLAVAVISALVLWGSDDAAGDELIFRGVGIGFVLFLMPLVYGWSFFTSPPVLDQELANTNEKLRSQLGIETTITLYFSSADEDCVTPTGERVSVGMYAYTKPGFPIWAH